MGAGRLPRREGGSVTFEPSPLLLHKQLTLYGSWVCGIHEMGRLLEHLERNGLHPETTVTHTFSLSDTRQAYVTFDAGKTGKVVILPGDTFAQAPPIRA